MAMVSLMIYLPEAFACSGTASKTILTASHGHSHRIMSWRENLLTASKHIFTCLYLSFYDTHCIFAVLLEGDKDNKLSEQDNMNKRYLHYAIHDPLTVYPKKYAHGFCFAVLCCGYTLTDFPISIRLTSLALWQSNDCPSASKATLMNMDKYFMWIHCVTTTKQSTTKPCAYFLGYTVRLTGTCHREDAVHQAYNPWTLVWTSWQIPQMDVSVKLYWGICHRKPTLTFHYYLC